MTRRFHRLTTIAALAMTAAVASACSSHGAASGTSTTPTTSSSATTATTPTLHESAAERREDAVAQKALERGLLAAAAYYVTNHMTFGDLSHPPAGKKAIGAIDPQVHVNDAALSTSSGDVVVDQLSAGGLLLTSYSRSGVCWYVLDLKKALAAKTLAAVPHRPGVWFAGRVTGPNGCDAYSAGKVAAGDWATAVFPAAQAS